MYTLGIDVGSSSVKVALLEVETGECPCAVTLPATEMPIDAVQSGWAEQDPHLWWRYVGPHGMIFFLSIPARNTQFCMVLFVQSGVKTKSSFFPRSPISSAACCVMSRYSCPFVFFWRKIIRVKSPCWKTSFHCIIVFLLTINNLRLKR